jgi:hypothetical protein
MNKSGYVEKKWHVCHPLSIAENSQEIQHDRIFRRDRYSEELYALRVHIELLRKKLRDAAQQDEATDKQTPALTNKSVEV